MYYYYYYYYYISNKRFLEECGVEKNLAVTGAVATSCSERRL
jgi:hypothetical protein